MSKVVVREMSANVPPSPSLEAHVTDQTIVSADEMAYTGGSALAPYRCVKREAFLSNGSAQPTTSMLFERHRIGKPSWCPNYSIARAI